MKVRFTTFDDVADTFVIAFELELKAGKIVSSNEEGGAFLEQLRALEKAGMGLQDSQLLVANKHEELLRFFVDHYNTPYLSASEI